MLPAMAFLLRLPRPFLLQRSCSKAAVSRLTTATSTSQTTSIAAPQLRAATAGAGRPADGTSSVGDFPSFASFDTMLNASGGTGDAVYKRLAERSIAAYNAERESVDAQLLPVLKQNKLVLFLEGSVDNPKSLLSMNVVKMLTQLQSVPLVAIDVTAHPAILGFALTHG